MKTMIVAAAAFLALPALPVFAQDDMDRRFGELKRWYDEARREAEQQFKSQMQKLERAFQEKAEGLKRQFGDRDERRREGGPDRPREMPRDGRPGEGMERMMQQLLEHVKRLEGDLRDLRHEFGRMRPGGPDRERDGERRDEDRRPAPPGRDREEMHKRFQDFGDRFKKMFDDDRFDWRRFSEELPREFREMEPKRLFDFFAEKRDWFPKDLEREEWFRGLHRWMEERRPDRRDGEKRDEDRKRVEEKKRAEEEKRKREKPDEEQEF